MVAASPRYFSARCAISCRRPRLSPNLSSFYMRDRAILIIPAEYGLFAAAGCSGGEMC